MSVPQTELILTSPRTRVTLTHLGHGAIRVDRQVFVTDRRCPAGYWRPSGYATGIRPEQLDGFIASYAVDPVSSCELADFREAIAANVAHDPFAGVAA